MPRKSAEALMMERFQPTRKPPEAPAHLSANAKRLWSQVVLDRPGGHFREGTLELLASYCEISARLEELWQRERQCRDDVEAQGVVLRHICRLATLQARLCSELRLTPKLNINRHSAVRDAYGNLRKTWDEDDVPKPWDN